VHPLAFLLLATLALAGGPPADSSVATCDQAIIGSGPADWRSESVAAGPVGVRRHPLSAMSRTSNGQFLAKMPLLIEGRAPLKVTVTVPPRLRDRVHLYYGRATGAKGGPTTSFHSHGYSQTEFRLCGDKPRTVWPGGIRIEGTATVHLAVTIDARGPAIPLRLGRPEAYEGQGGRSRMG
jgi:hypothetical protein